LYFLQDEFDEEDEMNMYRVQGTLREWVTRDEVRRFIAKKFKEFLLTYVNPKNEQGEFEYVRLINEMVLGTVFLHFPSLHERGCTILVITIGIL
jgi:hypothetical protein